MSVSAPAAQAKREANSAAWWQVVVGFVLIETALWTSGLAQVLASVLAAGVVLVFLVREPRLGNAEIVTIRIEGLWIIPGAAALSGILLAAAWWLGTLHSLVSAHTPAWQSWVYVPWAVLQQVVLQRFIFSRLRVALAREGSAILLTAILFAVAHLPNPLLVVLTFVAGLLFTEVFRRQGNVLALGCAHAMLGLAVAAAFPVALTHHMCVGVASR